METLKEKSTSRKSSKEKKVSINIETTVKMRLPDEEEIREKAEEIYHQRVDRGEYNTPEDDWFRAIEYLSDSGN